MYSIRRKTVALILVMALIFTGASVVFRGGEVSAENGKSHDAIGEWLSELNRLSTNMQKNGFAYGSCKYTYEEALKTNKRVNCGGYVGWALIHMGLFDSGKSFYYKNYFENHSGIYQVIEVNMTPQQLKKVLKPGDIVRYEIGGHHHVFAGWKSDGVTPLWYGAGRGMMWTRNAEVPYYSNYKIKSIIRIRTYNVRVSAENGTINGGGTYFATKDAVINYTPASGYVVKSVKVDGNNVDLKKYGNSITFDNINENHTVDVVYAKKGSKSSAASASAGSSIIGKTTDYINYRIGPGTDYEAAGTVGKNRNVYIYDYVKSEDDRMWYHVKINNKDYYMCADWITPESTVPQGKFVKPTVTTTSSSTPAATTSTSSTTSTNKTTASSTTTTNKTTTTTKTTTTAAASASAAKPAAKTLTGTTTDAVNYRTGPGTSFEVAGTVAKNKTVTVVDQMKGDDGRMWYHIKINSKDYYMCSNWVKVSGTVPQGKFVKPAATTTSKTTTNKTTAATSNTSVTTISGTTTDAVNYRTAAGTKYTKVGTIAKNKKVDIVNQVTGDDGRIWYRVRINNRNYFMSARWVTPSGKVPEGKYTPPKSSTSNKTSTTNTTTTAKSSSGTVTGKTTDGVNYRIGPGTLFDKAGSVAKGKNVTILASVKDVEGNLWYKVKISDKVYYMNAKWVKPSSTVSTGTANVKGITKESLNFRDKASKTATRLSTFDKNKQIQITGAVKVDDEIWYRVTYNNKTGYVSGRWVIVSVGS